MDPGYASGAGEKIKFFTRSGLEKCQVFIVNGKFYHYDANTRLVLYNSGKVVLDGVTGDIIVMDQQGNIFIHPKELGYIHHSSFFSQKPIAFGAMVRIKNGELVRSDFTKDNLNKVTLFPKRVQGSDCLDGLFYYSGHYDPSSGSTQIKNRIKKDAFYNFKKQLAQVHFRSPLAKKKISEYYDLEGAETSGNYYRGESRLSKIERERLIHLNNKYRLGVVNEGGSRQFEVDA